MADVIAVTNQKGGVGKTTTAGVLISGLSAKYKRVLGVDLDPQGSLGFSLGVDIENGYSVYEVMRKDVPVLKAIKQTDSGDILSSNILLSGAELEFNRPGREFLLRDALAVVKNQYDYIIIDTPPALNILTINAYTVSNKLLIPMIPDILSLLGISQLKETIDTVRKFYNPNLEMLGILLTKYNKRMNLTKEVEELAEEIARQLDTVVLNSKIRTSVAVAEAPAHGQSVLSYAPKSNAAADYFDLLEKIIDGGLL
ncbi:MAG: ParA family protein [Oscillospiraceae bacterium]|nr:ParA family protein [Oscillospiraceae bacterium]